jgi:hypothetical protein
VLNKVTGGGFIFRIKVTPTRVLASTSGTLELMAASTFYLGEFWDWLVKGVDWRFPFFAEPGYYNCKCVNDFNLYDTPISSSAVGSSATSEVAACVALPWGDVSRPLGFRLSSSAAARFALFSVELTIVESFRFAIAMAQV